MVPKLAETWRGLSHQSAASYNGTTLIPSRNFTPGMMFGNFLWQGRQDQIFFGTLRELDDYLERGIVLAGFFKMPSGASILSIEFAVH
jgi:hypothetical protein